MMQRWLFRGVLIITILVTFDVTSAQTSILSRCNRPVVLYDELLKGRTSATIHCVGPNGPVDLGIAGYYPVLSSSGEFLIYTQGFGKLTCVGKECFRSTKLFAYSMRTGTTTILLSDFSRIDHEWVRDANQLLVRTWKGNIGAYGQFPQYFVFDATLKQMTMPAWPEGYVIAYAAWENRYIMHNRASLFTVSANGNADPQPIPLPHKIDWIIPPTVVADGTRIFYVVYYNEELKDWRRNPFLYDRVERKLSSLDIGIKPETIRNAVFVGQLLIIEGASSFSVYDLQEQRLVFHQMAIETENPPYFSYFGPPDERIIFFAQHYPLGTRVIRYRLDLKTGEIAQFSNVSNQ